MNHERIRRKRDYLSLSPALKQLRVQPSHYRLERYTFQNNRIGTFLSLFTKGCLFLIHSFFCTSKGLSGLDDKIHHSDRVGDRAEGFQPRGQDSPGKGLSRHVAGTAKRRGGGDRRRTEGGIQNVFNSNLPIVTQQVMYHRTLIQP